MQGLFKFVMSIVVVIMAFVTFAVVEVAFNCSWWLDATSIVIIVVTASFAFIIVATLAIAFAIESFDLAASSFAKATVPFTETGSLTRKLVVQ